MASASSTFSGFAFFTLVYFIIKYFVGKNPNSSKSVMILMAIYIIIVMLMAYGSNVQSIKQMCGEPYFGLALMATIVPWTFIFGILNVALIMMPGWKAPFSNTFGYLLVKMNGIQGVFNDIFKAKMGKITINKAISVSIIQNPPRSTMHLSIPITLALALPANNKPRTTIPKSFFI